MKGIPGERRFVHEHVSGVICRSVLTFELSSVSFKKSIYENSPWLNWFKKQQKSKQEKFQTVSKISRRHYLLNALPGSNLIECWPPPFTWHRKTLDRQDHKVIFRPARHSAAQPPTWQHPTAPISRSSLTRILSGTSSADHHPWHARIHPRLTIHAFI